MRWQAHVSGFFHGIHAWVGHDIHDIHGMCGFTWGFFMARVSCHGHALLGHHSWHAWLGQHAWHAWLGCFFMTCCSWHAWLGQHAWHAWLGCFFTCCSWHAWQGKHTWHAWIGKGSWHACGFWFMHACMHAWHDMDAMVISFLQFRICVVALFRPRGDTNAGGAQEVPMLFVKF